MWTKKFWVASAERAIKTAAQTALALITADGVFSVVDVNWEDGAGVVALAVLASVLTSVVSSGVGDDPTSPSATDAK